MKRHLSAMDARKRFGELLEEVHYRGDEIIIERAGKPMAALVPVAQYEQWQARRKAAMDRFFALIGENWEHNKDVPQEEIEADIAESSPRSACGATQADFSARVKVILDTNVIVSAAISPSGSSAQIVLA